MDIVICGAGEVGRHAAEVLGAAGHNITIIDQNPECLARLEELLDVRLLLGDGTHGDTLIEAGCVSSDLFVAATENDVVNLLSASVAKGVGADEVVARVHHSVFFEKRGLDYDRYFGIDHLVCPEYSTAVAIAQTLRSPGALAVERFARGRIEMQSVPVSENAPAIGKALGEMELPGSTKVAAIERNNTAFIPNRETIIAAGDVVTLVGDVASYEKSRMAFHTTRSRLRRVMIMGGTSLAVWISRALHTQNFSVRIFESDHERAQELAAKLDWVTVLTADPADVDTLQGENVDLVDAFIACTEDDEHNILAAARAKSMGARQAITVLQRPTYLHLIEHVGIDLAFSPRATAVDEIQRWVDRSAVRSIASLAEGIDVFELRIPTDAKGVVGKPLMELKLPEKTLIVGIQRDNEVYFPSARDKFSAGDTVIAVAPSTSRKPLLKVFTAK